MSSNERKRERPRLTFETTGPSLTHPEFKDECDINRIMDKFQKTGILEHRNQFQGDYSNLLDAPENYHEAMNSVVQANEAFLTLPSSVRKRFGNDAGEFLEFVSDPKNKEEMEKIGLMEKSSPSPVLDENPQPAPKAETKKPQSKPAEPRADETTKSKTTND